jgi:predicted RNA-binding Zn-ribbon protein involved in translation (DUF1610 family)
MLKITKKFKVAIIVNILNSAVVCSCGNPLEVNPTESYFQCPKCRKLYYNSKAILARKIAKRKIMLEVSLGANNEKRNFSL